MPEVIRTNINNDDFLQLVKQLDAELSGVDGEDQQFYRPLNALVSIKHVVVVYENNIPIACGAMKEYGQQIIEIKRMFTMASHRGQRAAVSVLRELENWALELGYKKCILETGKRLPAAIALYNREGYTQIPNYGSYVNDNNSVCFEKEIHI